VFERFTQAARDVVVDAQGQARRLRHEEVTAEHLLLAVAARTDAPAQVLQEHGVRYADLAQEVAALGSGDAAALASLGIDLAAVRRQVEAEFGEGALERPRLRRVGLLRRRVLVHDGHLRFAASAKRALEQSLRQALALKSHAIGVEHVLLGLLADEQSPARACVRRHGADPDAVCARLRADLRAAA
jgi:ATP-dependent Clp protease ATP-binding subunit ClpA